MNLEYDHLFKVMLVGDYGVGKTSLMRRFIDDVFVEPNTNTIGADFMFRTVIASDKTIKMQIWDIAGQDRFFNINASYYRNGNGIAIVYDVTDGDSFDHIRRWFGEIERYSKGDVCILIIGNKTDMEARRVIPTEVGKALADQYHVPFIETSAKNASNVGDAFLRMASDIAVHFAQRSPSAVRLKNKATPASRSSLCSKS